MCLKKQWKLTCLKGSVNPEQAMLNVFLLTLLTSRSLPLLLPLSWRDTPSLTGCAHLCLSSLQCVSVHCNCKYVTQPTPDCIRPSSSLFSFLWVNVIFKEPGLSHVSAGVTVVLSRKWSEKNEVKWRRAKRNIYPIFLSFFGQFIQQTLSASSVLNTRQCAKDVWLNMADDSHIFTVCILVGKADRK